MNRLFEGLGTTRQFLRDVFRRNSLDDNGMRMDGYVHFGDRYNNAVFDGRAMLFGDGDGAQFTDFTQSLDVIAHELGHGITQFTAGLEYQAQPGALNESFSDVFGSIVKQWANGESASDADWLIGADAWTPGLGGDALRSMRAPGTAYVDHPLYGTDPQPAHMDDYFTGSEDNQGVHYNSGIPNKAFFEAATRIGGNAWDAAGHIWYEALKKSARRTSFQQFASFTYVEAAGRWGAAERLAVKEAWESVGIDADGSSPQATIAAQTTKPSGGTDASLNDVLKRLKKLSSQVDSLQKDVEALKRGKRPGK